MENNTNKKNLQTSFENQNIILILAGFLVGLVVGIGATYILGVNTKQAPASQEHEALKAAVRAQYPEYFEQEGLGTFYSGTVEEVKSDSIVIKREVPEIVLLASDLSEFKEIKIDENTQIIKETQKDPEQYNRELAEYEEAFSEYEQQFAEPENGALADEEFVLEEPLYPSDVEEKEISVGEINKGDQVSVSVQRDQALAGEEDVLDEVNQAPDMTTIIRVQEGFTDEALPEDTETIEGAAGPGEDVIEPEGAETTTAEPVDI